MQHFDNNAAFLASVNFELICHNQNPFKSAPSIDEKARLKYIGRELLLNQVLYQGAATVDQVNPAHIIALKKIYSPTSRPSNAAMSHMIMCELINKFASVKSSWWNPQVAFNSSALDYKIPVPVLKSDSSEETTKLSQKPEPDKIFA